MTATFVLIHGGGSSSWDWHLMAPHLRAHGHRVIAVDLPVEVPGYDMPEYVDSVLAAIGDSPNVVVVAHSWGALCAPVVCSRIATELLVLLAGMVPAPGETPNAWWSNTGYRDFVPASDSEQQAIDLYLQDVPADLAAEALRRERAHADGSGDVPLPFPAWPDVPTRFLLFRDDRFFPPMFLRKVVRERLGFVPDEMDGSHCAMLSRPKELADRLQRYWIELHPR